MADDDLQETLEALPAQLDHVVAEPVGEDLAGQGRNGHAGGLAFEDVAEVLKVGVATADGRVFELEGGDVGPADDLVVGVHVARRAVGLGILYLEKRDAEGGMSQLIEIK